MILSSGFGLEKLPNLQLGFGCEKGTKKREGSRLSSSLATQRWRRESVEADVAFSRGVRKRFLWGGLGEWDPGNGSSTSTGPDESGFPPLYRT